MRKIPKNAKIADMANWAKSAPPASGPIPDTENLADFLGAKRMSVLLFDDAGRVYHVNHINLKDANLAPLNLARSTVIGLMDEYGIQDGPDWAAVKD
jgi:hypothetical protein